METRSWGLCSGVRRDGKPGRRASSSRHRGGGAVGTSAETAADQGTAHRCGMWAHQFPLLIIARTAEAALQRVVVRPGRLAFCRGVRSRGSFMSGEASGESCGRVEVLADAGTPLAWREDQALIMTEHPSLPRATSIRVGSSNAKCINGHLQWLNDMHNIIGSGEFCYVLFCRRSGIVCCFFHSVEWNILRALHLHPQPAGVKRPGRRGLRDPTPQSGADRSPWPTSIAWSLVCFRVFPEDQGQSEVSCIQQTLIMIYYLTSRFQNLYSV